MDTKRYSDSYKTSFGREVLEKEVEFLREAITGCKKVLSIGCGPALHEAQLAISNPEIEIIGVDISKEMLAQAPRLQTNLNLIMGNAEQLCIKDNSVDCVYFLTSLEFIGDVEKALYETKRILKPGSRAIFMVANIKSWYVQKELSEVDSYFRRKLENMDSENLRGIISRYLTITSINLMLGIRGEEVFESEDLEWASLYVIKTAKRVGHDQY